MGELPVARSFILPEDRREFAHALARFAEGIRFEIHDMQGAALSNYVAAAELDPSNESLQFRVAIALLREKRPQEAIALMERAVRLQPSSDRALIWLALVYRSAEMEDKALATYRRAIAAAPTSVVAHVECANLLNKRGEIPAAIEVLKAGLKRVVADDQDELTRSLGELYLREATEAAGKGAKSPRLKEGLRELEMAVRKWPDDQALLLMQGNLKALNDDLAGAIACYAELEKRNPDDLSIKEKLAVSLMATGNKTGAVAALEGIAAKQPGNGRVFYYLGELYEQLGLTNKAVLNFGLAGKATPDDPLPFLKASMLHVAGGDYKAAEAILRKGLDGAPDQPRLLEMAGYVLMDQSRYDEALGYFDKAARHLAETSGRTLTANFRANHAIALHMTGKTNEALPILTLAIQTNAAALDAFVNYMFREGTTSNLERVENMLGSLAGKFPDNPRVPMYRGLILNSLERPTGAVQAFEEAERLAANWPRKDQILTSSFYFWYGGACDRAGDIGRAATNFLRSIALNADNAEARNYLAYMWSEHSLRLDEALAQIRKALEAEPENPAYRDTLGWIHFKRGDYEKAMLEVEKALRSLPDDDTIREHMGDILAKMGRRSEAVENWKKAYVKGGSKELPEKLRDAGLDPATIQRDPAAKPTQ